MHAVFEFLTRHLALFGVFVLFSAAYLFFEVRTRFMGPTRLEPNDLVRILNNESALLFDIRDKSAYTQGHILGSQSVPSAELETFLTKLQVAKDKPIILVCNRGNSTEIAGTHLKKLGYSNVYHLVGGMQNWLSSQMPVEKN